MVSGFMFSLVLTSSMPEFASTLSFRTDAAMNGGSVSCRVVVTLSGGGRDTQEPSQILRTIAGKCCDIVENSLPIMHDIYILHGIEGEKNIKWTSHEKEKDLTIHKM